MKNRELQKKLVINASIDSPISQAYSNLGIKIILSRKSPNKNLFLITSVESGEGRTITALNLSISLARLKKKVLLVDADLRNPTINLALGMTSSYTFSDIILKNIDVEKAVLKVEKTNLHVLTSEKSDINPFTVLNSPKVKEFFLKVKSLYDFVVVDSSSVDFMDPLILSSLVDDVLFVVRSQKSRRTRVLEGIQKIKNNRGKIIGIVVNEEFNPIPNFIQRRLS